MGFVFSFFSLVVCVRISFYFQIYRKKILGRVPSIPKIITGISGMHCVLLRPQAFKCSWQFLGLKEAQATQDYHAEQEWLQNPVKWWAGRQKTGAPLAGCTSCVELQTGTTAAEDPAHVAERIWLRISSGLIPQTYCALISQMYFPIQLHVTIKSQFIQGGKLTVGIKKHSKREPSEWLAGLNSLFVTDTSKGCYFM